MKKNYVCACLLAVTVLSVVAQQNSFRLFFINKQGKPDCVEKDALYLGYHSRSINDDKDNVDTFLALIRRYIDPGTDGYDYSDFSGFQRSLRVCYADSKEANALWFELFDYYDYNTLAQNELYVVMLWNPTSTIRVVFHMIQLVSYDPIDDTWQYRFRTVYAPK